MTPEDDDLRSPREKASKIPSWIMVGFILGALTFYTLGDYLARPGKSAPPSPASPPAGGPAPAFPTPVATSGTLSPAPSPAAPTHDTATKASPLLDNSAQMTLFAIDAVFRQWSVNAMWEYNTTQVVFWNPHDGKYSVPVEVFRVGTDESGYDYYYRRIDRITRPIVRDDSRPDTPILFTESEAATKRRKEKENERWWR